MSVALLFKLLTNLSTIVEVLLKIVNLFESKLGADWPSKLKELGTAVDKMNGAKTSEDIKDAAQSWNKFWNR